MDVSESDEIKCRLDVDNCWVFFYGFSQRG